MPTTRAKREPVILDTTIRDGSYAMTTNDDLQPKPVRVPSCFERLECVRDSSLIVPIWRRSKRWI